MWCDLTKYICYGIDYWKQQQNNAIARDVWAYMSRLYNNHSICSNSKTIGTIVQEKGCLYPYLLYYYFEVDKKCKTHW